LGNKLGLTFLVKVAAEENSRGQVGADLRGVPGIEGMVLLEILRPALLL
jgi:hypothetical protein